MTLEQFDAYSHAILAMALWGVLLLVLSGFSLKGRKAADMTETGLPKRDYSNPVYRQHRAYQNALETSGAFLAVTIAAILAGASPFWVNLLASIFIVSRIAMAVVHIGTTNEGLRSACYGIGWFTIIITGLLATIAVF